MEAQLARWKADPQLTAYIQVMTITEEEQVSTINALIKEKAAKEGIHFRDMADAEKYRERLSPDEFNRINKKAYDLLKEKHEEMLRERTRNKACLEIKMKMDERTTQREKEIQSSK